MLEASIGLIWKCTNAIRIVLSLYPNSGLLNVTNGPHSHYSVATKLYFTKKFQKIVFKKYIYYFFPSQQSPYQTTLNNTG